MIWDFFSCSAVAIALFIFHSIHSFAFIHIFVSIHKISLLLHCYSFSGACMRIIWYDMCLWFCFIFLGIFPLLILIKYIRLYCYSTIGFSFCQCGEEFVLFLLFCRFRFVLRPLCGIFVRPMIFTQRGKNAVRLVSSLPTQSKHPNRINRVHKHRDCILDWAKSYIDFIFDLRWRFIRHLQDFQTGMNINVYLCFPKKWDVSILGLFSPQQFQWMKKCAKCQTDCCV